MKILRNMKMTFPGGPSAPPADPPDPPPVLFNTPPRPGVPGRGRPGGGLVNKPRGSGVPLGPSGKVFFTLLIL